MRLNYDLKRPYVEALKAECEQRGMGFFVSDAHHKEKSDGAGCCGLPSDGPLSAINKGQFAEAIQIAKQNGEVRWSDISALAEPLKNIPYRGAVGFNVGATANRAKHMFNTMFEYMRGEWNNIESTNSPARYFGGALVPAKRDDNGDVVYVYNEGRPEWGRARR